MRFYKCNGDVYSFDSHEMALHYFGDANIFSELTEEEKHAHLNPAPEVVTIEEVNLRRRRAYADPVSGSDPIFAEASRMKLMGEEGWEEVQAKAIARYEEIQTECPWPEAE